MDKLNGVFLGCKFKSLIKQLTLKVHSVFKNVINIESGNDILSVVNMNVGLSSTYLSVCEYTDFSRYSIQLGANCYFNEDSIQISDKILIDINKAKLWKSKIQKDLSVEEKNIKRENLFKLYSVIQRYHSKESAFGEILRDNGEYISLLNGLKDLLKSEKSISCLIGNGIGLTPAGDDVILGFLACLNHIKEYFPIREKFHGLILLYLDKTTRMSIEMLKNGLDYDYHEFVGDVLYDMFFNLPENVEISTRKLLKIGATSGSDIATGLYLGFIGSRRFL